MRWSKWIFAKSDFGLKRSFAKSGFGLCHALVPQWHIRLPATVAGVLETFLCTACGAASSIIIPLLCHDGAFIQLLLVTGTYCNLFLMPGDDSVFLFLIGDA